LKIALLCNGFGKYNRGSEQFTEMLYQQLKSDYDINLFGIRKTDHSQGTNTKSRDNIKIPWRNGKAYLESYYFGKNFYAMFYKKRDYKLILNNSGFVGSYWCNKFRKLTGTPFITFERGGGKEEKLNNLFKPNCMVYLTEVSKNNYGKNSIKSVVIPIGTNIKTYSKQLPELDGLKGLDGPLILSTSALVGFKRIKLIIDAVEKMDAGTLIQTSSGNLKDEICRYGKEKLGDRFKYLGIVTRDALIALYQQCDVFANASKHEAFGVVYIEAMAAGLPIVTQYDKRRKEIIGDAGVLVADCEDINDFSSSLYYASKEDWEKKPMIQAKKYDWSEIIPLYKKLMGELTQT